MKEDLIEGLLLHGHQMFEKIELKGVGPCSSDDVESVYGIMESYSHPKTAIQYQRHCLLYNLPQSRYTSVMW